MKTIENKPLEEICRKFLRKSLININKEKILMLIGSIIDNIPIGVIILDDQERIIAFNKMQERNSRISKKRTLNKKFLEVFPKLKKIRTINEAYRNLIINQVPFDIIIDGYIPQYYNIKTTFRIRGSSLGNKLGYVLLCEIERDLFITKRKLEEKIRQIKFSRNFLSRIINSAPLGFLYITKEKKIFDLNRQATILFGYSRSSLYGKNISILFPKEEYKKINEIIDSLLSRYSSRNNFSNIKTFCLKSNREKFFADLYIINILNLENENKVAIILLFRDITEEEKLKENLINSEKMALLGKTLGELAHQLNNPIVGLINLTEVLYNNTSPTDKNFELIKIIKKAGSECRAIIYNVLDCYRVTSNIREININKLLKDCEETLSMQNKLDGIRIKSKYAENIPLIHGNEVQLKQAILNILNNSIEAMPSGGVININTRLIKPRSGNKYILVVIADTGVGIPDNYYSKIFEPLFTTKPKGTGLGLSFTYNVIKELKGDISVHKRKNKGTIFKISIPISIPTICPPILTP